MGYLDWEGDGSRNKEALEEQTRKSQEANGQNQSSYEAANREALGNALRESQERQEEERKKNPAQQKTGIYTYNGNGSSGGNKGGSGSKGGNMTLPPGYTPQQGSGGASREEEWFKPKTYTPEAETKPAPAKPAVVTPAATTPEKEADDQDVTRYTPKAAEQETSVTYTPPSTTAEATKNAADTAARTKDELTTEQEEDKPQWMKDLEEANAEDRRRRQANATANYLAAHPEYMPAYRDPSILDRAGTVSTPDAYRDALAVANAEDQRRRDALAAANYQTALREANAEDARRRQANATADYLAANPQYRGVYAGTTNAGADQLLAGSVGNAAREDTTRRINEGINAGMRRPGYDYVPPAGMSASRYEGSAPVTVRPSVDVNALGAAQRAGYLPDPRVTQPRSTLTYDWQPTDIGTAWKDAVTDTNNPYFNGENTVTNTIEGMKTRADLEKAGYEEAKKQPGWTERDRRAYAEMYADQKEKELAFNNQMNQAVEAGRRAANEALNPSSVQTPTTPSVTAPEAILPPYSYNGSNNGSTTLPGLGTPSNGGTAGGVIDTTQLSGTTNGGTNNGTNTGTNTGTNNGTTTGGTNTGTGGTVPDGSKTYNPSYEQGGSVVKAPYKVGGYTEAELIAMGNNGAGTDRYGNEFYEGYYKAPDGNYYPVDQMKANYWRRNGGSYAGWDEGMRDYYNTFGTFYGYRPDWKIAGKGGGKGGSGGKGSKGRKSTGNYNYNYNGNGNSGNYGSGTTPNNGLYWNGNTSWSI